VLSLSSPRIVALSFAPAVTLLRRLLLQERGIAAVEFSLILPVLVLLWIGGVEVTSALSVDRRMNNLSSSIGDLVARSKLVTYDDVNAIFSLAPGAMFPYDATNVSMRITAVDVDASGNAKVAWSRSQGSAYPAYTAGVTATSLVPATLRVASSQVIMSEAATVYTPAVGYVIVGNRTLTDRLYFVPRLVTYVQLCDNDKANCLS
jgi:Flp pilus assembly protein TadG